MTLYIDADGCPVVDIALHIAKQHRVEAVILCDTSHEISRPGARTITVSKGADSVDFALVNLLQPGDLAITQDYGLAAMCLARRAAVLSQNGLEYTAQNIDSLLLQRHASKKTRRAGGRMKGPQKRTPEQDEAFADAFAALLARLNGNMGGD